MNPRQRRGVILIALAAVGAIAVFLSVSNYVADVRSQVGPLTTGLRLVTSASAFEPVTADMIEPIELPERWAPPGTLADLQGIVGTVSATGLPAGTLLQDGMLIPQPELAQGERELAILVDAETGVAGKIGPGTIVDIYATFPGSETAPPQALIIVQQARILEVGIPQPEDSDEAGAFGDSEVVPVTFALSVAESLQLAYIESFAQQVRLALRAPDDEGDIPTDQRRYQPLPAEPLPTETTAAAADNDDDEASPEPTAEPAADPAPPPATEEPTP